MYEQLLSRRNVLAGVLGVATLGLTACAATTTGSTSTSTTSVAPVASGPPSGGPMGGPSGGPMGGGAAADAAVKALEAEVKSKFKQSSYSDSSTGKKLPFNVFLPAGYDASNSYPMVLFIADSSLVGQAVTAPLTQYGVLIWASSVEQAKHKAIVVVPEFPSVIIDDQNGGHTMTEYIELTARFVKWVQGEYAVDPKRVYATGQSMGCMTLMYLAANHPALFTAELFVSGQWQVSALAGLSKQKFFYIAAGGDENSTGGQKDVEALLTKDGVNYKTATWDATWSVTKLAKAADTLLADGYSNNFATFTTGSVLKLSSANNSGGAAEHLSSFEPAYKITPLRDWLFAQRA